VNVARMISRLTFDSHYSLYPMPSAETALSGSAATAQCGGAEGMPFS
jgi:hypothetical protein